MPTDIYRHRRGSPGDFHSPTPYQGIFVEAQWASTIAGGSGYAQTATAYTRLNSSSISANAMVQVRNRLASALRGTSRANVALTAIGWRQSLDMIGGRAGQMLTSFNYLRKGRVLKAIRVLSQKEKDFGNLERAYKRKWSAKKARKEPANAWLELNFGWSPLVQDIHDTIGVLGSSPAWEAVGASAKDAPFSLMLTPPYNRDYRPGTGPWNLLYERGHHYMSGQISVRAGCMLKSVNPNAALASGLGLTNPAFVLWDAVPFSFVVDWFIPVGSYLKTFDAFVGFETTHEWITVRKRGSSSYLAEEQYRGSRASSVKIDAFATIVERSLGLPPIQNPVDLRPSVNPSLWQAVTSLALLQGTLERYLSRKNS